MAGIDTSATGFFSDFSSGIKGVVSDVTGWVKTAKSTITGWTDSLGLTGSNGLFGGADGLLGSATQWAGVAGSLLKGDIKGAISGGLSVGANMLGTAIAGSIGGLVAGFAANALTGLVMGGGETRSGGLYDVNQKLEFSKVQGPSGGDLGGKEGRDKVSEAMVGTVKQINTVLEKLGSKAKVLDFKAAVKTSDKGRGGVYAGGQLSTGQAFGEQFKGQNVFESQTSRSLKPKEAMKAFALDLKQATLQAVQSATDIPKYISNILKDVDIEALGEEKINQMLSTIDTIQSMQGAFSSLGISMDSITPSLIESAGGIENFKNEMATFSDKFVGEQNKSFVALNTATDQISNSLKDMGLAIPATRDGFKQMVKGLDMTTEAGQQTFGSLMKLVPAFDQLYAQQESAINQYFDAFGTPVEKATRSQADLTKQFTQFGLQIPKSEAEFQALAQQLYAGDQNAKNQAVALMQLYPQWKANETAQIQAGNALLGFTANLKAMANSITDQTVNQNLTKAVTDAKSPVEAGNNFAAAMMQSIQQAMVGTLIQSISQAVMTGLVQPMMTGASNAAMMQAQGGSIAGMNMAQGGAMSATAQSQGGAMAATSVATGAQNAANAMATGGAAAANAMSAGGQSVAERVQTVIAQAREMMSTMTAVMKDEGMQAAMKDMMDGFKVIGAETYTATNQINQSFSPFVPVLNDVKDAATDTQKEVEKIDFKKFKDSLKDFSTGLEGDNLKMSKIQAAFQDVDLSSLKLSGSLENMASQIAALPDDKLTEIASAAKLSVDDMQSYVLDFFNISRQRAKEATEAFKSLQSGINPKSKIEELSTKYGVNSTDSAFKDSTSYFGMLGTLTKEQLQTIAEANHVTVSALVQDALDYGNALKENEQKFKDFTKSLNDLGNFEPDQNKNTLASLSAKYGQQINMTSAEYLKFAQSLKPEDIAAIAATYGLSVDEVQKDLLDAGGALKGLAETARTKAIEDFKAAIGAIDNSLVSVKGSIEDLKGLSAEQILDKTKKDWQLIISSGQNLEQLTDATDKYKTAIEDVRQKQLKAIEDYRAGINKAIEDSQSFKKTLESDIFNLRKTLGKSGTSNVDQMGLVQKQLAGISGKSQVDLEKQTELQGRLKDLILGNLDDQINAQQKVFDTQKQQFEAQIENSKALIGYAKDLKGFVDGLMLGDTSILTNEQRVTESQRQYQELLGKAKSGDQDAIKGLSNAASSYLKEARNYLASSDAYTAIFKDVTSTVSGLAGSLETQGNAGVASNQRSLDSLSTATGDANVKGLQETALAQLMALETARQQTETDLKALLTQPPPQAIEQTQYDSVIATVNDAAMAQLEGMQASLEVLGNQTVDSFGLNISKLSTDMGMNTAQTVAAIQGMQADFGGRLSAIVGVVQQAQADAAAAQAQAAASAAILARDGNMIASDFTDLPSYDVGTPSVQGDQVAKVHNEEMIIDPQSSDVLRNYGIRIQTNTPQQSSQDYKELIAWLKSNSDKLDMLIQVLSQIFGENATQTDVLVQLHEIMGKLPRSLDKLQPAKGAK